MLLDKLCPPALLYIAFSIQYNNRYCVDYKAQFSKILVMMVFSIVINLLYNSLSVVAWFITFIPFIMLTVISSLFTFGLSPMEN